MDDRKKSNFNKNKSVNGDRQKPFRSHAGDAGRDKREKALREHKESHLEYMDKRHNTVENAPLDTPSLPEDMLAGRNSVMEALKGGSRVNRIMIANGSSEGSIRELIAVAKEKGIMLQYVDRSKLDSLARGIRHQGVLAQVAPVEYAELEDILQAAANKGEPPFIVLLDELEDPHNLGAILRTADAAGVHGVLIPKRRSCPLSATVAKTSAGAVEHVPVARIGNVVQTLKKLKEQGMWVAGADMDGSSTYYEADLTGALVLVIGNEGHGMSRLTKEQCDFIVSIPMQGKINSLNASVAGSILMYESLRQRTLKKKN